MIKFTIYGKPNFKRRHRTFRNKWTGQNIQTADPKGRDEEETFRTIIQKYRPEKLIDGAIQLQLTCYVPIPKSMSKKKRELAIQGILRPITKPDLKNYLDFIEDCFNNIIWIDDRQVCVHHTAKLYSETPRVEVGIEQIGE